MRTTRIGKHFFSRPGSIAAAGAGLVLLAGTINGLTEKPVINLSKQDTALNVNQNLILYASAGHKRLITDLLWIQTLMESDLEHYSGRDLNNWLFHRFNTITTLDPRFYQNYLYGGLFLGIVKDDLEGADVIYTKGLAAFPDDFRLNYNAGFLRYFELGDYEAALGPLQKIQNHPRAPVFLQSIVNKLMLATGTELEEIFKLVLFNYTTTTDEALKHRLGKDLYAIRAQIDLECLNNNGRGCQRQDLEGNPYQNRGGTWHSPRAFLPYKINPRGNVRRKEVDTMK
jgi:hypothetical protein